jgi:hypothetical protein
MNIRPLQPSDIPTLRQMYEYSGFAYEFPDLRGPLMESVMVAVDENDVPVAAIAAERILQAYLLMDLGLHPATKLRIIRSFHEELAIQLRTRGYHSLEAFLPPPIAESFGRRLMRSFGWVKAWPSYCKTF